MRIYLAAAEKAKTILNNPSYPKNTYKTIAPFLLYFYYYRQCQKQTPQHLKNSRETFQQMID